MLAVGHLDELATHPLVGGAQPTVDFDSELLCGVAWIDIRVCVPGEVSDVHRPDS